MSMLLSAAPSRTREEVDMDEANMDEALRLALEEAGWGNATGAEPFASSEDDDFGTSDPRRLVADGFHVTEAPYWTSKVHEEEVVQAYERTIELVLVNVFGPTRDRSMRALQEDKLAAVAAYVNEVLDSLEGAELADALARINAGVEAAAGHYGDAILLGRTLRAALREQGRRVKAWRTAAVRAAIAAAFEAELTSELVNVLRTATPTPAARLRRNRGRRDGRRRNTRGRNRPAK